MPGSQPGAARLLAVLKDSGPDPAGGGRDCPQARRRWTKAEAWADEGGDCEGLPCRPVWGHSLSLLDEVGFFLPHS